MRENTARLPVDESPSIDLAAHTTDDRRRLSGPGLRTFLSIADRWRLDEAQRLAVLGRPGRSTYYGWRDRATRNETLTLGVDVLLRLSAVLGVHRALVTVFTDEEQASRWLRSPNTAPLFGGQAPLDLIVGGTQDGILQVRRHLDAWAAGGPGAAPDGIDDPPLSDADLVID